MQFLETSIPGACRLRLEKREDPRGFFARTFCEQEFAGHGLRTHFPQSNLSYNQERATIRGLHFQRPPKPEIKVVRCLRGAVYDVIVDLRPSSPMYRQWEAFELNDANREALYIPEGCAHGFQTLVADTEMFYQMGELYTPECNSGFRWNDPAFQIDWPLPDPILSEKDQAYPDFRESPWA